MISIVKYFGKRLRTYWTIEFCGIPILQPNSQTGKPMQIQTYFLQGLFLQNCEYVLVWMSACLIFNIEIPQNSNFSIVCVEFPILRNKMAGHILSCKRNPEILC